MGVLIAFCANGRQAGKDTAANFVEEWCREHDKTCERLAFAEPGKRFVAAALGIPPERIEQFKLDGGLSVETHEGDGHHLTGRDVIIHFLNAARQIFGDDVWVKYIFPNGWRPTADVTVVTDMRFPIEADRVLEFDGKIVEINRIYAEGGAAEGELAKNYPQMPVTRIYNDGPIASLRHCIFSMLDELARE